MMGDTFDPRKALQQARHTTEPLPPNVWHDVMHAFIGGAFTPTQMAAWLMARVLHSVNSEEAVALTDVMLHSGAVLSHTDATRPVVDKHSTGGVGDSTTLIVAPLAASVGLNVAKLSGKSLGHTGGTLDKLAAIPGMRTDLDAETFRAQVETLGIAVAAATQELAPADRLLYALRDHVELVDDTALIAASIMSKKLATGANYLVLDVKLGQASLLSDDVRTRILATQMTAIGKAYGRKVTVVFSDMNQPLGPAIGNALEVNAAIDVLAGKAFGRLGELSVTLTVELLHATGVDYAQAQSRVRDALSSGHALARFEAFVSQQGGDPTVVEHPREILGIGAPQIIWKPSHGGYITNIDTRALGVLARDLAGETNDLTAGLDGSLTLGANAADVAVGIHTMDPVKAQLAVAILEDAVSFGASRPSQSPLVTDVIR